MKLIPLTPSLPPPLVVCEGDPLFKLFDFKPSAECIAAIEAIEQNQREALRAAPTIWFD